MPRPKSTDPFCRNGHARIPANITLVERCRCCNVDSVTRFRERQRQKVRPALTAAASLVSSA